MKFLIPTRDDVGLDSKVFGHLPMASYFSVVEVDGNGKVASLSHIKNDDAQLIIDEHRREALAGNAEGHHEHNHNGGAAGGGRRVLPKIIELKPDVIFVTQIGPAATDNIRLAGIKVLRANGHTIKEVIDAYLAGKIIDYQPSL